jgi:hypothetical protein
MCIINCEFINRYSKLDCGILKKYHNLIIQLYQGIILLASSNFLKDTFFQVCWQGFNKYVHQMKLKKIL